MAKVITKAVEQLATSDLIELVAQNSDYTKEAVKKVINDFLEVSRENIIGGNKVVFKGIGSFSTSVRAPRTGRNPQTGESIQITAKNVIRFKPSTTVKTLANKR